MKLKNGDKRIIGYTIRIKEQFRSLKGQFHGKIIRDVQDCPYYGECSDGHDTSGACPGYISTATDESRGYGCFGFGTDYSATFVKKMTGFSLDEILGL